MDRRDFIKTAAAAGIVAGFQPLSLAARAGTGNLELPLKYLFHERWSAQ
jgi:hypothetical protein